MVRGGEGFGNYLNAKNGILFGTVWFRLEGEAAIADCGNHIIFLGAEFEVHSLAGTTIRIEKGSSGGRAQ